MKSSNKPIAKPNTTEPPISITGSAAIWSRDGAPVWVNKDSAVAAAMLKIINANASSIPTTASKLVVSGPLASYSASTSTVVAGSVAAEIAPKTSAMCQD
jgi:hypothetical protein